MASLVPSKYLNTLDAFLAHWEHVDAALAPATLVLEGFGRPELLLALRESYSQVSESLSEVGFARSERDRVYLDTRERLVRYRLAVKAHFPETDPLVTSMPRLQKSYSRRKAGEPEAE